MRTYVTQTNNFYSLILVIFIARKVNISNIGVCNMHVELHGMKGFKMMHNEELHSLYSSPEAHEIKEDEMGGACRAHGEMRNVYKILVGKPKGKRPL
jgi:hypothetical protein